MLGREPALWLGLISAVVNLGVLFGAHLSTNQQAGVMTLIIAAIAWVTRSQVSPAA